MGDLSGRLVTCMVALASIFVILFGIRETATILNPILLAIVITITVLAVMGQLTKRGLPGKQSALTKHIHQKVRRMLNFNWRLFYD